MIDCQYCLQRITKSCVGTICDQSLVKGMVCRVRRSEEMGQLSYIHKKMLNEPTIMGEMRGS